MIPSIIRTGLCEYNRREQTPIQITQSIQEIDDMYDIEKRFIDKCKNFVYNISKRTILIKQLRCIIFQIYHACNENVEDTFIFLCKHYLGKVNLINKKL